MTAKIILVQVGEPEWTLEAVHAACLLARSTGARIVLLKMIPVQHANWLGTDLGSLRFSVREDNELTDYRSTVEDYGLECDQLLFQYATWVEGTLQAVEHVEPDILFAPEPAIWLAVWKTVQMRAMKTRLKRQKCAWVINPVYSVETEPIDSPLHPYIAAH